MNNVAGFTELGNEQLVQVSGGRKKGKAYRLGRAIGEYYKGYYSTFWPSLLH